MVGNLIDELSGLFIKANTKESFLSRLANGEILSNSIVFIIDTNEIWTQGNYWSCPYNKGQIDSLFSQVASNIDQVRALYSELGSNLTQYQQSTNQLIAEKEQIAATALAAEVARASEQESRLAAQISSSNQALNTEIGRATAAEGALRTTKVDKEKGKSLVLDTEIEKLAALNTQETITNDTKVSLEEIASTTLYKQYSIKQGGVQLGTIDIPKDQTVSGGSIKTVTESGVPYEGAAIGDKYFDFIADNTQSGHIYISANDLVDTYTQGNGIKVENKIISIVLSTDSEGFLTLGIDGLKLSGVQSAINVKYTKPSAGIPKTDLTSDVQTSLNKADTALQEHQSLAEYTKTVDVNAALDTKVDKVIGKSLVSDDQITKLTNLDDQTTITSNIADAKKAGTDAQTLISSHTSDTSNPHNVTKAQVGLGDVDNTSDLNKPISTATQLALDKKVDKVTGKGLSTNDYTTDEKTKLSGIEAEANKTIVDSALSSTSTNPVQNKIIKASIDEVNTRISWKTIE